MVLEYPEKRDRVTDMPKNPVGHKQMVEAYLLAAGDYIYVGEIMPRTITRAKVIKVGFNRGRTEVRILAIESRGEHHNVVSGQYDLVFETDSKVALAHA